MGNTIWTFESLAQADRATLENVLFNSSAPDPEQLAGYVYDGYNHDWLGQLPGKKFRKAFLMQVARRHALGTLSVERSQIVAPPALVSHRVRRLASDDARDQHYGLNQIVEQDGKDFTGEWHTQRKNGRPVELGFFKILAASESASNRQVARYHRLMCFDYNIDLNPRGNLMMRAIRDYVGLPNAGDYELVLGKAYLQVIPFLYLFASYFVLGHRRPYERS